MNRNNRECLKKSKFTLLPEREDAHKEKGPSEMWFLRKPWVYAVGVQVPFHSPAMASELRMGDGQM